MPIVPCPLLLIFHNIRRITRQNVNDINAIWGGGGVGVISGAITTPQTGRGLNYYSSSWGGKSNRLRVVRAIRLLKCGHDQRRKRIAWMAFSRLNRNKSALRYYMRISVDNPAYSCHLFPWTRTTSPAPDSG